MAAPTPTAFATQPEEVVVSMQDRNSAGSIAVGKLTSQTSSGQLVSKWSSSAKKVLSAQRASSGFVTLRDQFSVKEVDAKELQTQQRLGEGAFAVVDKCILMAPGQDARVVAVKRLKKEVANSPLDLEAFLTEVALMRKLKHKSIVTYIGLGADDHSTEESSKLTMFFVQEFMGGGTLRKLVSKQMSEPHRTVYTNSQALQWMIDIASSLAYLHSSNPIVIHRDLKMDNILLTSDKANAKLADFGLAGLTRHTTHKRGKTEDGAVVVTATEQVDDQFRAALAKATSNRRGTLRRKDDAMFQPSTLKAEAVLPGKTGTLMYMAPEMYNDEPYTEKVDVFSFGIIMHELFSRYLTVCAISNSGTEAEVEAYVARVANGFRPPLEDQMWHEQLKSLIRDCWAQSPSNRPDMATVVQRLQQMQTEGVIAEDASMGCSCCVVS